MKKRLMRVYERLHAEHGAQEWWPADHVFEVMVGAVLTQNTAWTNVERAIDNLKSRDKLDPHAILAARHDHLARWVRPSGYFNVKARRLKALCRWYIDAGGFASLKRRSTEALRDELLAVDGVGYETADDILLYAFERPVFVIDAYTRRLFGRLGLIDGNEHYDELRLRIEAALGPNVPTFNEYHALIVNHGKDICKARPRCADCCLARMCPTGKGERERGG